MDGTYIHGNSRAVHVRARDIHRVKKAWGEEQWIVNKEYCGKKLVLKKNHRCSMHTHAQKDEVFYVQSGKVKMELGGKAYVLGAGDFVHVRADTPHRFTGLSDSEIIEFSTNHREDDSFRTELSGHVDQSRYDRQAALVEKFPSASVLVLGDAMLDSYVGGEVNRISPEAPIPIVRFHSQRHVPGGAANAAANIASLGGRATLLGVRGADGAGKMLESLLKKHGVRSLLKADRGRMTTEKQRIVAGDAQQIVRVDYEHTHALSAAAEKALLTSLQRELRRHDVLLLSDYAKGIFRPEFLQACIAAGRKARVPVILDPKPDGPGYLASARGVTLITPNRGEAQILAGTRSGSIKSIAPLLSKKLKAAVLCTLGGDGMLLAEGKMLQVFPAAATGVVDVSGAGDTVAATIALALAAGAPLSDAIDLSNRAAGVVVEKAGTATAWPAELLRAL
jgi:D-beta-D-heptose 7-phosphate kinase/D-beta-D-heptose 1-phosphate adenosyltransferase